MTFVYDADSIPNTPYPLFAGWGLFADLFGQQAFKGPIRGYAGDVNAPSFTFVDADGTQNRTGWYQPFPNSIGAAIAGFLRFYVDEEGTAYRNTLGFAGKILAENLTADQTYQLPDASGTIALVETGVTDTPQTNGNAGAITIGTPVYVSAADTVDKARANALATTNVLGLMVATTLTAVEGSVRSSGSLEALTTDWDAVTGETGGLTAGAEYFLSGVTAGKLVKLPIIDTPGNWIKSVGLAYSSIGMMIDIKDAIGI